MCRFPSPLTVAAVRGGYLHAPPEGPAMQRAGPAPGPVDVFSCRPFDPDEAAAVAVSHFGGRPKLRVLER